jgi:hypothetical protein
VPTKKELLTLVDFSAASPGPTIDAAAFPGTEANFFWSATPMAGSFTNAWRINFATGDVTASTSPMSNTGNVRCVR